MCDDKTRMSSIEALGAGLAAQATDQVKAAAQNLARATRSVSLAGPTDVVDLSAEMVALMAASQTHGTAMAVIAAGDELDKQTLNILA